MDANVANEPEDRLTVDALRYYVPIFQAGLQAENDYIEFSETLPTEQLYALETLMKLKKMSSDKVAELASPLITREIHRMIASSHSKANEDLFTPLYYAGISGMQRGLAKFDVDKLNSSSTNYLFQWIVTYAKKELNVLEAPFGIPPSRFRQYKKISAVRKKLSNNLNRYASNQEVFEYLQSGQADLTTMNGRLADKSKPSQANLNITYSLVEEQEEFERKMMNVNLLDSEEGSDSDARLSVSDAPVFSETVFGAFADCYNVTDVARAVIMSELNVSEVDEIHELLQSLKPKEYRALATQWKNLVRDVNGPFYEFLKDNVGSEYREFDVAGTIRSIEAYEGRMNSSFYHVLFEDGKPRLR